MTQREIGVIISKLDSLHEDVRDIVAANKDLTARVTKIEQEWSWFRGVSYTIIGICSSAIGWVTIFFKGH